MNRYINAILATLLVLSGVSVILPSGYVNAGGMICNPSFEQGVDELPTSWNVTGDATRVDTGPIYAGNWSARITGDGGVLTQWISVGNLTLPMTYNAWGWVYVSGNVTGKISVDFWTGVNQVQLSETTELSTNDTDGEYVQVTGTMTAPYGASWARISLLGTGWNKGGEARFDEIGFWIPSVSYCFIATAAYGTETAAELDILRDFRDKVLLKNALGSRFVEAYYRLSPPLADLIAKNAFLRTIVREVFIDPVVNLLQLSQDFWKT
jgi:hypothetical protein